MKILFPRATGMFPGILFASITLIEICGSMPAQSQGLDELRESLSKRSSALEADSSIWTITQEQRLEAVSEQRKKDILKQIDDHAMHDASKIASKNHAQMDIARVGAAIKQEQSEASKLLSGASWVMKSSYTIARNRGVTVMSGDQLMSDQSTKLHFNQTYRENWACIETVPISPPGVSKPTTRVYATPGNSLLYRPPVIGALDVLPEELSILTGSSLLARKDVEWHFRAVDSSSDRVVVGEVKKGEFSPYRITMLLSAAHGMAPASITAESEWPNSPPGKWTAAISVTRWSNINGVPAVAELTSSETGPNWYRKRSWQRSGAAEPAPSALILKKGDTISDHRLQGDNLRYKDVFMTKPEDVSQVVVYGWNGKLPDLSELEKLKGDYQERMGAAHPAAFWLFVPGIIAIGSGIAAFRFKGRNSKRSAV